MDKNKALKILNPILAVLVVNQLLMGLLNDALSDEVFEVFHGGGGFLLVMGVIIVTSTTNKSRRFFMLSIVSK